eukprot:9433783-Pyramimonas_sp.AAC.1
MSLAAAWPNRSATGSGNHIDGLSSLLTVACAFSGRPMIALKMIEHDRRGLRGGPAPLFLNRRCGCLFFGRQRCKVEPAPVL